MQIVGVLERLLLQPLEPVELELLLLDLDNTEVAPAVLLRVGTFPLALAVRIAPGMILGGALGNLADRLRLGYVVDFIDLRWWPVFNVADSCIVVGVALLALAGVVQRAPQARA